MKRPSLSKRMRFWIFQRDDFTCQYCGAEAPDVKLVIDHRIAVANGGASEEENLVTACEACNQGKSDLEVLNTPHQRMMDEIGYAQSQYRLMESLARLLQVLRHVPTDERELERAISWAEQTVDNEATEFTIPEAGRPFIEKLARNTIPEWW